MVLRDKILAGLKSLRRGAGDLSRIFFPVCCHVCRKPLVEGEQLLCLDCMTKIPLTGFDRIPYDNPLHYRCVDLDCKIDKAVSFFYYKNESAYSRMIRDAKYYGRPQINRTLGRIFATHLRATGFFDDIDLIIPVPVHWARRLMRGYNQTEYIARGISEATGIPVVGNLIASRYHRSQTSRKATERREALRDNFKVIRADQLTGKHILLVDDVITTGATILTCGSAIYRAAAIERLSVLSLGAARLER